MIDEVVFLRHGRTAFNVARRLQGQIDVPLDIIGQWQADQSASELARRYYWAKVANIARHPDTLAQPGPGAAKSSDIEEYRQVPASSRRMVVVSSDLFRALQTAHAFADMLGLDVTADARLRERSFGQWEGMTRDEIRAEHADAYDSWRVHTGGELAFGVESRTATGLRGADADDGPAEAAAALVDDVARSRKQDVATMLAGRPDVDDDAADDTSDGMPQTAELGGSDASAQPGSEEDNPYRLAADLGTLMEHALAVRCDARSISEALNLLDTVIRPRASRLTAHSETPAFNQEITAIWEVRHLTLLAEAMLRASEARHESRGSLQRLDYPARDDERFLAHSMIGMADAADAEASSAPHASILWQSVHINDFPPKTREY